MPDRTAPASGIGTGGSLRHAMEGEGVWRWIAAAGNTARLGRIVVLVIASATAFAAGWGDRPLLAAVFAGGIVASIGYWRVTRGGPPQRLEVVAATGWTGVLLALTVASRDAAGAYYDAPAALVALAAITSFSATLRPSLAACWAVVTSAAILLAHAAVTTVDADDVLTAVAMVVVAAMTIAANVARRDAELDRRDLADLARRLDQTASVPTMATAVTESIAGWGMFGTVGLIGFEGTSSATVLSKSVLDSDALPYEPGESLPPSRAAYLRDRAERGPWLERPARGDLVVGGGRSMRCGMAHALAYAPILSDDGVAGLIVAAARLSGNDSGFAMLADELPVLVDAASLAATALVPALARVEAEVERRESLSRTISRRLFHPVYQPVLDLGSGTAVGYEALSRFDDGTPPDRAFEQAERLGLGLALEEVTLRAAVAGSASLPEAAWLSLNLSPAFLLSGRAVPILSGQRREIVLELTEHVAIDDYAVMRRALRDLGPNVRLAVDDAGAGFASLRHVIELEPEIVKLDLALVRGIDGDASRQALLSSLCHFAAKTNCRLLAEGIETDAELETIRSLGIGLGQGYLLGRPAKIATSKTPLPGPEPIGRLERPAA